MVPVKGGVMPESSSLPEVKFSTLRPEDQGEVRELILAGLADHWGVLDPSKNPDLEDMAAAYPGGTTLVARMEGRIVATGTLVPRGEGNAEIVRMSVAADHRRMGLGSRVLGELLDRAKAEGFRRIVLETTSTWTEVIAFYTKAGFRITHNQGGDTYFELPVDSIPG
jgi:ribosomal protein S18 acetylase RimI-like enzyme